MWWQEVLKRIDWTQVITAGFVMLPLLTAQIVNMISARSAAAAQKAASRDHAQKLEEVKAGVNGQSQELADASYRAGVLQGKSQTKGS
jgi:hypothetical protein